jgi:hypothetical protein
VVIDVFALVGIVVDGARTDLRDRDVVVVERASLIYGRSQILSAQHYVIEITFRLSGAALSMGRGKRRLLQSIRMVTLYKRDIIAKTARHQQFLTS